VTREPVPSRPPGGAREVVATAALLAALLFGSMAVGLAIAVTAGGGSPGALFVGFMALPLAFGVSVMAWRSIVGAWFLAILARTAIRSRGDEGRFREEAARSFRPIQEAGPAALPGTWVFVPTAVLVGLVAAVAMAIVGGGDRVSAPALVFVAALALGLILRALARRGLLPLPDE